MGETAHDSKPRARMTERFWDFLRSRMPDSRRFFILCAVVGLLSGLVAVAFHMAIHGLSHFLLHVIPGDPEKGLMFWLVLPLIPAMGGTLAGIIMENFAPGARGSGIPQTKAAYYNKFGLIRFREGVARFILGSLSIGSGISLGREGPTVHICSAIASTLGQWLGMAKPRIQAMVPVGMGAGIASAFNTPLAAITFVFEELLDDFSSKAMGGILIAVVIAAVVSRALLGANPSFEVDLYTFDSYWWTLISVLLGLAAAVFGHWFVGGLLWARQWFGHTPIPAWLRPGVGGLSLGILGTLVLFLTGGEHRGVFGIGYEDLTHALTGTLALKVVIFLFIGKFIATILAYASGSSGGLFAPVLFIGGMLGAIIGAMFELAFDFNQSILGAVALLGMGAFFAAVIRCPLTSLLIIFEMTLNYSLILPLMVGNMIAYYLSNRWRPIPLYNALLIQDKVNLKKMPSYMGAQDWKNLPVSTIMTHDPISAFDSKSLKENLEFLRENKHHAYPVRAEDRKLVNVITHHELEELDVSHADKLLAELLPEHDLVVLTPNTSIREAARIMVRNDIEQVPVVSHKNVQRLVGFVTLHDIARQQNAVEDQLGR